jgi:hypothetical protein
VLSRGPGQAVVQHLAKISEAVATAVVNIATNTTPQIEVRPTTVFWEARTVSSTAKIDSWNSLNILLDEFLSVLRIRIRDPWPF